MGAPYKKGPKFGSTPIFHAIAGTHYFCVISHIGNSWRFLAE